jgi:hypothetical protein
MRDDSQGMGSLRGVMWVKNQHMGMDGATKTNEMGSLEEAGRTHWTRGSASQSTGGAGN